MRWWVCFSAVLHLVLLAMLLLVPSSTARRDAPPRVYTVDLVAPGPPPMAKAAPEPPKPVEAPPEVEAPPKEQVKAAPEAKEEEPPALVEPAPPKKPQKKVVEPAKPAPPKKVAKPKKKPRPKPKVVKREKPAPKKTAAKKASKKKVSKKRPSKKTPKLAKKKPKRKNAGSGSKLVERLRKRRIDDAVAVARERARLRRAARREGGGGVGGGSGTSGNGGVVRGVEFLAYRHQMLDRIKDRWTWIGKRGDLEVTVGFGVGVDGGIFGLKLLKFSGDASFDESVVRAVRRSSPLPPPPAGYVRDFAQVEITFRPTDLDG